MYIIILKKHKIFIYIYYIFLYYKKWNISMFISLTLYNKNN